MRWLDWGWLGKLTGQSQSFPVLSVVSRYEADSQYESCSTDGDEYCWGAVGELRIEPEGGIRVDFVGEDYPEEEEGYEERLYVCESHLLACTEPLYGFPQRIRCRSCVSESTYRDEDCH